jgi:hypothetical protein
MNDNPQPSAIPPQPRRILITGASSGIGQQAALLLNRFVGAQITRYYWGGFSGYLDVLGIEAPQDMKAELKLEDQSTQLMLIPRTGQEAYVARVEAIESVPRGVVCRGEGKPGAFPFQSDRLGCPTGWRLLGSLKRLRPNPEG